MLKIQSNLSLLHVLLLKMEAVECNHMVSVLHAGELVIEKTWQMQLSLQLSQCSISSGQYLSSRLDYWTD